MLIKQWVKANPTALMCDSQHVTQRKQNSDATLPHAVYHKQQVKKDP
jgi:hypothetical protein